MQQDKVIGQEETSLNTKKASVEIQLKQLQLNSLLQITEAINQNFTRSQLLSIYEFVLRNQLKVEHLILFTHDEDWELSLVFGVNVPIDFDHLTSNIEQKPEKEFILTLLPEGLNYEEVIPVYHKAKPLAFAVIGKVGTPEIRFKEDILPFIQTITNLVTVALENKKLARDSIMQAGIKKELALAAQMQSMLFPEKLPHFDNVDMAALYLPHQEVGGDYYDFIRISENEFITCMADVSGKGVPAALLMSNFQATLHALARHCTDLKQLVEQLNDSVLRSAKGEKFITLFICKFNSETREFEYVNAGHNPPVLLHSGHVSLLDEGTIGLGMFEKLPFLSSGKLTARKNAEYLMVCYTDGIVELEDEQGNMFGIEKLSAFVLKHKDQPNMNSFVKKLMTELNEFREKRAFVDDVTLLACRCRF